MLMNRSVPPDTVLPHVVYQNVVDAIEWLTRTFGFRECYRYGDPVSGAQMQIGKAWIMLKRARDGSASPAQLGYGTQSLTVFLEDLEAHFERTKAEGARILEDLHETVYGELQYAVEDLDGHHWLFSRHARDVNPEEFGATLAELPAPSQAPEQPAVNLWELTDHCTPWCLHVVATLRIADHIAAGIDRIDGLGAAAKCDASGLHRVLAHLASKGVFVEIEPGRFALNQAARGLLDPPALLGLDLNGIGGRMAYAWGTLLKYVQTGASAYHEIFGLPFWEDLNAHPEVAESFDALIGPAGHGAPNSEFEITGGWETVRTVVDVGGGTGAMLAEILRARPHIHGTLVDLPRTVARSAETFRAAGVTDRVTTVGQSFLDPLPAGADIYLLRGILNDWPDSGAAAILRRCAEAARPAGRVVVLKSVGPDDAPGGLHIEMVLLGGKHRTVTEFRELASQSGLEVAAASHQAAYFVVECRPRENEP